MQIRPNSTTFPRPDLATVAAGFSEKTQTFIADLVLPNVPVPDETGIFYKEPTDSILQLPSVRRTPGSNYNRITNKATTANWFCEEFAIEKAIDRHDRKRYPSALAGESACARRCWSILKRQREKRVADMFNNTNLPNSGTTGVAISGGSEWTVAASTPSADVASGALAIENKTGVKKSFLSLILPTGVMAKLAYNTDFITKMKTLNAPFSGDVTEALAALYFGVKEVLAPTARYNTLSEDATPTLSTIWNADESYLFLRAEDVLNNGVATPGLGWTYRWAEMGTDMNFYSYGEDPTNCDVVRAEEFTDEIFAHTDYAYRFTNVAA